ncbi:uncharacterized protein LOC142010645 [Carettochelys insculpta]|uniref:uncharacterized protein LOC142010645 n=1 Tax=Carettochelys insculpta TaxID=44489 RepID=UPI003EC14C02
MVKGVPKGVPPEPSPETVTSPVVSGDYVRINPQLKHPVEGHRVDFPFMMVHECTTEGTGHDSEYSREIRSYEIDLVLDAPRPQPYGLCAERQERLYHPQNEVLYLLVEKILMRRDPKEGRDSGAGLRGVPRLPPTVRSERERPLPTAQAGSSTRSRSSRLRRAPLSRGEKGFVAGASPLGLRGCSGPRPAGAETPRPLALRWQRGCRRDPRAEETGSLFLIDENHGNQHKPELCFPQLSLAGWPATCKWPCLWIRRTTSDCPAFSKVKVNGWLRKFQMTHQTFEDLCHWLALVLQHQATQMRPVLPVQKRLASSDSLRSIGHQFGVSKATVRAVMIEVVQAINRVPLPQVVTLGDLDDALAGFADLGFPSYFGALDGTRGDQGSGPRLEESTLTLRHCLEMTGAGLNFMEARAVL